MSSKVELTLLELSWLTLLQMYEVTGESLNAKYFKTEDLPSLVNSARLEFNEDVIFRLGLFRYVTQKLNEQKHIYVVGAPGFQITTKGIEYIQSLKNDPNSALNRLLTRHRRAESSKQEIPASDRSVPLDHNSAAFREAVEALDASIKAVETANDIGDLTAGERSIVLSQLREGRKLFDLPEIKVSAVRAMIEPKLRWVADKAFGTVVGALALAALGAIGTLLGVSW